MSSRRRSGRNNKRGNGVFMLVGALLLVGAGAGGYVWFGGKSNSAQVALADIVPQNLLSPDKADKKDAAPPSDESLAQVNKTIAECEAALNLTEKPRETGLRDSYGKLGKLLEGPLPLAERERALKALHAITGELFLSPVHNEFSEDYIVKGGDSYERVAVRAGVSKALVWALNNKPRGTTMLHTEDNLKLPRGAPSIVVRKDDYTASLYFGDKLVRQYIIAHGANDNTPEGVTSIANMEVDPEKAARGPSDPRHEMRLRWIGLKPYDDTRTSEVKLRNGFGFHGTASPESIPGMTSKGCIRMKDADVIELYDIVREGTKVEIKA